MLAIKIWYHIIAIVKKAFYKIIYGKRIKFGKGTTFRKGFSLMIAKDAYVEIGNNCFFNNYCSINSLQGIKIGINCIFGENVKIYDHNHVFKNKNKSIMKQGFKVGTIEIKNNCWICSNVVILKDTKIGENSVIGAGCIVKHNVKDNSILKRNDSYLEEKINE